MKKIKQDLKPGKTNKEERLNFIRYWADYVKYADDKEWSRQQNKLINSQLQSANKKRKIYKLK
ncbi:MAG: hypothetical protein ACP5D2_05075 [Candidatus Nanoarchaeia archaeon]